MRGTAIQSFRRCRGTAAHDSGFACGTAAQDGTRRGGTHITEINSYMAGSREERHRSCKVLLEAAWLRHGLGRCRRDTTAKPCTLGRGANCLERWRGWVLLPSQHLHWMSRNTGGAALLLRTWGLSRNPWGPVLVDKSFRERASFADIRVSGRETKARLQKGKYGGELIRLV